MIMFKKIVRQVNLWIINGNSCSKIRSICSIRGQKDIRVIRARFHRAIRVIRAIRVQKKRSISKFPGN